MVEFVIRNSGIIMTILFLISELLGESESIRSNSIFGLIRGIFKTEAKKSEAEIVKALEK